MKAFFDDVFSLIRTDPRQLALRDLAYRRGWRYAKRSRFERQPHELRQLELFQGQKEKRVLSLMMMGSRRVAGVFSVYDYIYYGDLSSRQTTVFQFQYPGLQLAQFSIRPKGFLSAVKEIFVTRDRLFATSPDFDKRYELATGKTEELKEQLNEDFLDEIGDEEGWTFEARGEVLVGYRYGALEAVEDIEDKLEHFEKICDRLVNGKRTRDVV